jgi:YihY family inner membrane protein
VNAARRIARYLRFTRRVLRDFSRNHGLLLAGGVGYNLLLSIVPLFAVLGVVLSHVTSEEQLLVAIETEARMMVPGQAELLVGSVRSLLDRREVVGWVGFAAMLFFSSLAFRMLDDAIAIIFHRHSRAGRRRAWVAVLLPYAYVLVLGFALLLLTGLVSLADGLSRRDFAVLGVPLPVAAAAVFGLWVAGYLGVALLVASIYKVLPVVRIAPSRALVGGLVAAALWEVSRRALLWWFANLSVIDTVYGSLGTVVFVLLYLEAAAVILLLGAQVIAELERSASAGVAWHVDPDEVERERSSALP